MARKTAVWILTSFLICSLGSCLLGPGACFPSGTQVLTSGGPLAIERVEPGTEIYSYELTTGQWKLKKVLRRLSHDYRGELITIQTVQGKIQATENHPFLVLQGSGLPSRPLPADVPKEERGKAESGRWVEARHLEEGDVLQTRAASGLRINRLSSQRRSGRVYNLAIQGGSNYAIQRAGILVHNKSYSGQTLVVCVLERFQQLWPEIAKTDNVFASRTPEMRGPYSEPGDVEYISFQSQQYYPMLRTQLAARMEVDVAMLHSGPRQWKFSEYLVPLDGYIEGWRSAMPQDVWAWHCRNGNPVNPVQMVPLTRQGIGVYYNKANLDKAHLDPNKDYKVWTDFLDACEALQQAGITPIAGGNSTTGGYVLQLLWASLIGDEVETLFEPGQENFRDPRIRRGAEYLLELQNRGFFDGRDLSSHSFSDSLQLFDRGGAGFFIGRLSDGANWKEISDAIGAGNCGYFPNWILPESVVKDLQVVNLGLVGYSILTKSRHPEAAAKYLKWWAVGQGAETLLKAGALPASAGLHVEAVRESYPVAVEVLEAVSGGPTVVPYVHYLPDYSVAYGGVGRYVELLIGTGEIDIDEFIDRCQSKLEEYF